MNESQQESSPNTPQIVNTDPTQPYFSPSNPVQPMETKPYKNYPAHLPTSFYICCALLALGMVSLGIAQYKAEKKIDINKHYLESVIQQMISSSNTNLLYTYSSLQQLNHEVAEIKSTMPGQFHFQPFTGDSNVVNAVIEKK